MAILTPAQKAEAARMQKMAAAYSSSASAPKPPTTTAPVAPRPVVADRVPAPKPAAVPTPVRAPMPISVPKPVATPPSSYMAPQPAVRPSYASGSADSMERQIVARQQNVPQAQAQKIINTQVDQRRAEQNLPPVYSPAEKALATIATAAPTASIPTTSVPTVSTPSTGTAGGTEAGVGLPVGAGDGEGGSGITQGGEEPAADTMAGSALGSSAESELGYANTRAALEKSLKTDISKAEQAKLDALLSASMGGRQSRRELKGSLVDRLSMAAERQGGAGYSPAVGGQSAARYQMGASQAGLEAGKAQAQALSNFASNVAGYQTNYDLDMAALMDQIARDSISRAASAPLGVAAIPGATTATGATAPAAPAAPAALTPVAILLRQTANVTNLALKARARAFAKANPNATAAQVKKEFPQLSAAALAAGRA